MSKKPLELSSKKNYTGIIGLDDSVNFSSQCAYKSYKDQLPFSKSINGIASYELSKRDDEIPDYRIKIVVVGDGSTGKTCFLISCIEGRFPEDYVPTIFENYITKIKTPKNKIIELALWDTAGQEEYSRLRPLSYGDVDVVIVCYTSDNNTSLQNVEELWLPEVIHFCPNVPIILLGLKSDLYVMGGHGLVDPRHAKKVAQRIGAIAHLECSSKTRHNLTDVLDTAIHIAMDKNVEQTPTMARAKSFKFFKRNNGDCNKKSKSSFRRRCTIL